MDVRLAVAEARVPGQHVGEVARALQDHAAQVQAGRDRAERIEGAAGAVEPEPLDGASGPDDVEPLALDQGLDRVGDGCHGPLRGRQQDAVGLDLDDTDRGVGAAGRRDPLAAGLRCRSTGHGEQGVLVGARAARVDDRRPAEGVVDVPDGPAGGVQHIQLGRFLQRQQARGVRPDRGLGLPGRRERAGHRIRVELDDPAREFEQHEEGPGVAGLDVDHAALASGGDLEGIGVDRRQGGLAGLDLGRVAHAELADAPDRRRHVGEAPVVAQLEADRVVGQRDLVHQLQRGLDLVDLDRLGGGDRDVGQRVDRVDEDLGGVVGDLDAGLGAEGSRDRIDRDRAQLGLEGEGAGVARAQQPGAVRGEGQAAQGGVDAVEGDHLDLVLWKPGERVDRHAEQAADLGRDEHEPPVGLRRQGREAVDEATVPPREQPARAAVALGDHERVEARAPDRAGDQAGGLDREAQRRLALADRVACCDDVVLLDGRRARRAGDRPVVQRERDPRGQRRVDRPGGYTAGDGRLIGDDRLALIELRLGVVVHQRRERLDLDDADPQRDLSSCQSAITQALSRGLDDDIRLGSRAGPRALQGPVRGVEVDPRQQRPDRGLHAERQRSRLVSAEALYRGSDRSGGVSEGEGDLARPVGERDLGGAAFEALLPRQLKFSSCSQEDARRISAAAARLPARCRRRRIWNWCSGCMVVLRGGCSPCQSGPRGSATAISRIPPLLGPDPRRSRRSDPLRALC